MEQTNPYNTSNDYPMNPAGSAMNFPSAPPASKANEIIDSLNKELAELLKNLKTEWHEDSPFFKENTDQMEKLKHMFEVYGAEDFRNKDMQLSSFNYRNEMEDRNCCECCYRYNCDADVATTRACRGSKCECLCRGLLCCLLNIVCCFCLSLNSCCTAWCGDKMRPTVSGELRRTYNKYKR